MPASTFVKTIQTALLSLQSLASNTVVKSSELAVTTTLSASVYIHFGRRSATALTTAASFRIEGAASSSGDGHWFPLAQFLTNIAAVGSEAVSGTCAAGQNVIAMASTTGFTVGVIVFIDNGTIGNSEWGRVKVVTSNTSVTLEDNLIYAQTGSTVYADAQVFTAANLDLSGVRRLRAVVDGSGTGQAVALEVEIITCDSIG